MTIFEKELEFVQLLCNPEYLRWLYNEKYFDQTEFIEYLKYLCYFKNPKYASFLLYPQSVVILEMLIDPNLRLVLENDEFYIQLANDQYYTWASRK